jgi:hypothetical protein
MDPKAKRKVIADMLARLQRDMDMAVEQMPDDWDETELGWYLIHRAELLTRAIRSQGLRTEHSRPPAFPLADKKSPTRVGLRAMRNAHNRRRNSRGAAVRTSDAPPWQRPGS